MGIEAALQKIACLAHGRLLLGDWVRAGISGGLRFTRGRCARKAGRKAAPRCEKWLKRLRAPGSWPRDNESTGAASRVNEIEREEQSRREREYFCDQLCS